MTQTITERLIELIDEQIEKVKTSEKKYIEQIIRDDDRHIIHGIVDQIKYDRENLLNPALRRKAILQKESPNSVEELILHLNAEGIDQNADELLLLITDSAHSRNREAQEFLKNLLSTALEKREALANEMAEAKEISEIDSSVAKLKHHYATAIRPIEAVQGILRDNRSNNRIARALSRASELESDEETHGLIEILLGKLD